MLRNMEEKCVEGKFAVAL